MPQKTTTTKASQGATEDAKVLLISELEEYCEENGIEDAVIILIPDTGKAKFNGSHVIASGKSAGKDSKATFIVAESQGFYGDETGYSQSQGDVEGLPLTVKFTVTATPPNRAGKTIEEALNRKPELVAVAA